MSASPPKEQTEGEVGQSGSPEPENMDIPGGLVDGYLLMKCLKLIFVFTPDTNSRYGNLLFGVQQADCFNPGQRAGSVASNCKWLVLNPPSWFARKDILRRLKGCREWHRFNIRASYKRVFCNQSLSSERKRFISCCTTTVTHSIMSHASSSSSPEAPRASKAGKHEYSDANIRNFAPVARIMKTALPENAKIAKEAKECMQECVSEFISFITSEGSSRPEL